MLQANGPIQFATVCLFDCFSFCLCDYNVAGFLSSGAVDSSAPGNYALYDVLAALHWIKENVRSFGGDPHRVTLMGHGHGAALVNLLAISPVTRG